MSIVQSRNQIALARPLGQRTARAIVWLITMLLLAVLLAPATISAQETVWEQDGLAGLKVRSLAVTVDSLGLIGLTLGATGSSPLWIRGSGGWSQPTTDLPHSILTAVPLPEGGILVGTARDIAEQPGLFWLGGNPLTARRLYDAQAIGALAVEPGENGTRVYAAAAPYGDREAGAYLLRWDTTTDAWPVVLHGTLFCGDLPSYFKQVVAARDGGGTLFAVEECFASVARQTQLWRSDDHGQTWHVLPRSPTEQPLIGALTLDPSDANVLYLAGLSPLGHPAASPERSLDGGRTWAPIGRAEPGLSFTRVITPDPRSPGRVFAAGERGGVFVSADHGDTWQALVGLEHLRIWSLCLDHASSTLLAGTSDGVWRMALP